MAAQVTFASMFRLLRTRPDGTAHFRLLWLSDVVSHLGDWLSMVALAVLITHEHQSGFALGLLFTLHTLPHVVAAPWAGKLADRFDRKRVMQLTHVVRGGLTLGMVVCAAFGWLLPLQGVLLLRVVMSAFFEPAARAALPRIVDDDELAAANALQSLSWSVLFAAGMALGGLLASWLGPVGALALDAITFFIAAGLLFGLPSLPPLPTNKGSSDDAETDGDEASFGAAWRVVKGSTVLWRALWAKTPLAIAGGVFWVVLNLVSTQGAQLTSSSPVLDAALTFGLLQSIRGVGTGVGPVVLRRFQGKTRVLLDGLSFVFTLWFLWTVPATGPLPLVVISAILLLGGMITGHNWVESSTALSLNADDAYRGRISAWDWMLMSAGQSLAALAGGALVDATSAQTALTTFVALGALVWLLTGVASLRRASS